MAETLEIRLHPKQTQAYQSKARVTAFVGGIQSGKSTVGGLWMARQVALKDQPDNTFIIASPNFKIQQQSILGWTLRLFHGAGVYKSSDSCIKLNGGGTIYLRSMLDPDSLEGIAKVQAIWADEAGLLTYRSWSNILGRSAFCKAPIFLSTTPYSQNFLYRDIYLPYVKGQIKEPDCKVITCKSSDNPYFDKGELERQRRLMDPRIYRMKYEAAFEKLVGLVYPDFSMESHSVEIHKIPRDRYFIAAGIDIGFNDPFCVIVCAIEKGGEHAYAFAEYYHQYISHTDRISLLRDFQARYGIQQFYADSASPADIDMMAQSGLPVTGVAKGPGSVMTGIAYVTSLIRDRRFRVMEKTCPNLIEEFNLYAYPETQLEHDAVNSEKPLSMYDHAMDALRYCLVSCKSILDKGTESKFIPAKTHLERLLAGEFEGSGPVIRDSEDWYNH